MVARLIHRHAIADRLFPGSFAGDFNDIHNGDVVLFGVEDAAACAVRDAAYGLTEMSQLDSRLVDLGNMDDPDHQLPETLAVVSRRCAPLIMMGGNTKHGATFLNILADTFSPSGTVFILLSSRLDIAPLRKVGNMGLAIGTTRLVGKPEHHAWRSTGGEILPAFNFNLIRLEKTLNNLSTKANKVLLLVDMSVVDTGYAAGALFRNIGGLSPVATLEAVARIRSRFEIKGLGLLNLAPERDPRGHSERIAAMIIQNILVDHPVRTAP
ncbi:MAG: hypothetical protein EB015_10280 [Methylocystaceae bacterium]|nr:hypothetical protein [Methylocystaceae bacterium]